MEEPSWINEDGEDDNARYAKKLKSIRKDMDKEQEAIKGLIQGNKTTMNSLKAFKEINKTIADDLDGVLQFL